MHIMGGTSWSTDDYKEAARLRKKAGKSDFAYNDAARSTGKWVIHPTLDPKGVTYRESRDSETHPRSNAISVLFDETGSMGGGCVSLSRLRSEEHTSELQSP